MSKALTPIDEIRGSLIKMGSQFKAALPKHIPVDKFIRVAQTAITTSPQLLSANRQSLFAACVKASQDGLLPDGKEAALVTFRSKSGSDTVQYMPMVAGILKKVRNSGELSSITAQLVYEKDLFKYYVDETGEHISHEPKLFGDRGNPIGVYAIARTKDNAVYVEVMTADQVGAVRNSSRSKDSGPWAGAFAHEMWKKTAIRRLSKRLPMSTDLETTIQSDDDLYSYDEPEVEVSEAPAPAPNKPTNLRQLIKKKSEVTPAPADEVAPDPEPPGEETSEGDPI